MGCYAVFCVFAMDAHQVDIGLTGLIQPIEQLRKFVIAHPVYQRWKWGWQGQSSFGQGTRKLWPTHEGVQDNLFVIGRAQGRFVA